MTTKQQTPTLEDIKNLPDPPDPPESPPDPYGVRALAEAVEGMGFLVSDAIEHLATAIQADCIRKGQRVRPPK
jgi:hypothetical protein